jgi:hypothetical protein
MATGPDSGVWAMDCEIAQHGTLPDTLVTATCHGGQYLFNYPSGHTIRNDNSGKRLGDGLDIMGIGGYD